MTENTPLDITIGAVNALGLASSCAHIILRSNQKPKQDFKVDIPILTCFSTRSEAGIKTIIEKV